ncbi:RDD family protein [Streptomyces sp. NPDC057413]|uniref:RDD family protein n=1 Tax=unclassified Streptomyces TaxID=2593676 RepID=UPI00365D8BB6
MAGKPLDDSSDVTPSDARRLCAVVMDAVLSIVAGLAAGVAAGLEAVHGSVVLRLGSAAPWAAAFGSALAVSFVNQVLVAWTAQRSLGKLVTRLRVVRDSDGGRPRLSQLVRRWLFGFGWMLFAVPVHVATDSDISQQDASGLRIVRGGCSRIPRRKA